MNVAKRMPFWNAMSCILVRRYLGSTKYWYLPTRQQDVRYTLLIFIAMKTKVSECKKKSSEIINLLDKTWTEWAIHGFGLCAHRYIQKSTERRCAEIQVTYVPKRAHNDSRDSEIFYTRTDILKIHSTYFSFFLLLSTLILQVKLSSKFTSFNGC
jgi:hypothetical protein